MKKATLALILSGFLLSACGPTTPPDVSSSITSSEGGGTSSTSASSSSGSESSSSSSSSSGSEEIIPPNPAEILERIAGTSVAHTGELTIGAYTATTGTLIKTVTSTISLALTPDYYYFSDIGGDVYSYVEVYKDAEGYAYEKWLSPANVVEPIYYQLDGAKVPFDSMYANPFALVKETDFEIDGTRLRLDLTALDETLAYMITMALVGDQGIPLGDLYLEAKAGTIVGAYHAEGYSQNAADGSYVLAKSDYSFELVDPASLDMPYTVEALPTLDGHDDLGALFDALRDGNYTLDIVRLGGESGTDARFENTAYFTEDTVLRTSDGPNGTLIGTGYHYDEEKGLIATVSLEDGILKGTGSYGEEDWLISDYVPDFTFAPEVFDIEEDGSFTLKTGYGFEEYIQYTSPDYTWDFMDYLYYLTPGTYNIALTPEGAKITYDYSYYYQSPTNLITGTIEMDVRDIGTTVLEYPYEAYVPNPLDSWDDLGEEAVDILTKYLGQDYLNLLPYLDVKETTSYAPEWRESAGGYAYITYIYENDAIMTERLASYQASLVEAGYRHAGQVEDGWEQYLITVDGVTYDVRVKGMSGRYLYIRIYPSEAIVPLDEWLTASFSSSNNSRGTATKKSDYYYLNADGGKGELYQAGETDVAEIYYTDTAVRNVGSVVIAEDGKGGIEVFSESSTGEHTFATSYEEMDLATYLNAIGGYLLPENILAFLPYIQGDLESGYSILEAAVPTVTQQLLATAFGTFRPSSSNEYGTPSIAYDGDSLTITLVGGRKSGNYYLEETYTYVIDMVGEVAPIDTSDYPRPGPATLEEYFVENFGDGSNNSYATYENRTVYYHLDENGEKGEFYQAGETEIEEVEIADNGVRKAGDVVVIDTGEGLDVYLESSTGELSYLTSSDQLLNDYLMGRGFLLPTDIYPYLSYLSDNGDGTYSAPEAAWGSLVSALYQAVTGYTLPSDMRITAFEVAYLPSMGTGQVEISWTMGRVSGNYYVETTYEITIYGAGEVPDLVIPTA